MCEIAETFPDSETQRLTVNKAHRNLDNENEMEAAGACALLELVVLGNAKLRTSGNEHATSQIYDTDQMGEFYLFIAMGVPKSKRKTGNR